MKLFYRPAACSLSPHIIVRELGLDVDLVEVERETHTFEGGKDFYDVNPHGYVPALEIDEGRTLLEGPAIVQYLADLKPEAALVPPSGSFERYKLQEVLSFQTTEIHKGLTAMFYQDVAGEYGTIARDKLRKRFEWLDVELASCDHVFGTNFSVADAYLFALIGWAKAPWLATYIDADFSVDGLPHLRAWYERVRARPAVQDALRFEGLA